MTAESHTETSRGLGTFGQVVSSLVAAVCLMQASDYARPLATVLWLGAAFALVLRMKRPVPSDKRDRLSLEIASAMGDALVLMAAGYCNDWVVKVGGVPVGWVAAVLAVSSALIRVLGEALAGQTFYLGPVTSSIRLQMLVAACWGSIVELWLRQDGKCAQEVMRVVLAFVVLGSVATCYRRFAAVRTALTSPQS